VTDCGGHDIAGSFIDVGCRPGRVRLRAGPVDATIGVGIQRFGESHNKKDRLAAVSPKSGCLSVQVAAIAEELTFVPR
jgi:hypothetical protein